MKKYRHREFLAHTAPCLTYGIITGTLVGILIFFFKLGAEHLEELSHHLYSTVGKNPLHIVGFFTGLTGLAAVMYYLHKLAPEVKV